MGISEKKQHNIALAMLSATAIIWGIGFILNKLLLQEGFEQIPLTLNAVRFSVAAVVMLAVFARKIAFSKKLFAYGAMGGLFLAFGFGLQILGLNYTTPSANGFFTTAYVLFVPFGAWMVLKKRPTATAVFGVLFAIAGLGVLNISAGAEHGSNELLGNMLTLTGALFFAAQIVATERAVQRDKIAALDLTVLQIVFCALFTAAAAAIFEGKHYPSVQLQLQSWWKMAIVSLLGTAFAYFSQTYAQSKLSSTETSIVLAFESPFGATLSIVLGIESFQWKVVVGGLLMVAAVVAMEILPEIVHRKHVRKQTQQRTQQENHSNNSQPTH